VHEIGVIGNTNRTRDRQGDIRDHALAPSADLISKDSQSPDASASDRAFRDHTAVLSSPTIGDRGHFDDELGIRGLRHQSGVVKVSAGTTLKKRRERLVRPPAEAHNTRAGTKRNPIEVEAGPQD
jgi:hypothetical protein